MFTTNDNGSVSFIMKYLVPNGDGWFFPVRFAKNNQEGAEKLRDTLLAAGDWGDATQADLDNFNSALPAIREIGKNEERWIRFSDLSDELQNAVRQELDA